MGQWAVGPGAFCRAWVEAARTAMGHAAAVWPGAARGAWRGMGSGRRSITNMTKYYILDCQILLVLKEQKQTPAALCE